MTTLWFIERRNDLSVVAQAVDGRDAVEMYERHKPDVCLIDLKMPVMDGVAANTRSVLSTRRHALSFSPHSMGTKTFIEA